MSFVHCAVLVFVRVLVDLVPSNRCVCEDCDCSGECGHCLGVRGRVLILTSRPNNNIMQSRLRRESCFPIEKMNVLKRLWCIHFRVYTNQITYIQHETDMALVWSWLYIFDGNKSHDYFFVWSTGWIFVGGENENDGTILSHRGLGLGTVLGPVRTGRLRVWISDLRPDTGQTQLTLLLGRNGAIWDHFRKTIGD